MAEVTLEQAPKRVRDLFNKGFGTFERGNLDYAIDMLYSCVEMEPGLLQARKFLRAAEIQRHKQKKSNPVTKIVNTIAGFPAYVVALAVFQFGKPAKALLAAEKLLKKQPLEPRYVKLFAHAAADAGFPEAAVQTLEVARDHNREEKEILRTLGGLYQDQGETKAARECFEKLCELSPNDPAAVKALKDAMALDSMKTDGWSEAAEKGGTYREMIRDTKEAELLEQQAKAVKSTKDADALIQDAVAKIEAEPENINYYKSLARLYRQKKMFDEAIEVLEKAVEVSGGDPELDAALSSARVQKFDAEIAALKEAGDEGAVSARKEERDAYVYEDLQSRVKRYPNDLKLRYDLGIMQLERGLVNEAIQQFQLSQKSPTHRVASLYYLAVCFKQKSQYDLAQEQLEAALAQTSSMDDTKKSVLYELGEVAELLGDKQKAAGYYKQIYQVDIGYRDIAEKIENLYAGNAGGSASA